MNPADIALVKSSFRQVAPIADQAAALFYARLFEIDPKLRPLFHGDMHAQGRKLMAMLASTVGALDRLDTLLPAVRKLGARHARYGVTDDHYVTVGSALLWTLERALGPAFTPEVKAAWADVYTTLAHVMMDAAHAARAAAA